MDFLSLCKKIELPKEVIEKLLILETEGVLSENKTRKAIKNLCDCNKYEEEVRLLSEEFSTDKGGFKMLYIMLKAALFTYEKYILAGISEEIFVDTLKAFSRFVKEHKVSYGVYGFDRYFWTGRQLSLTLFRLGCLEYEFTFNKNGEKVVSIHIPSDADISEESVNKSLVLAKDFINSYREDYKNSAFICCSWLLSPVLKDFLPKSSRILAFASRFDIIEHDKENQSYKEWLYKNRDISPENFCENTSLQRKIKVHVLAGGYVGEGSGILKNS